MAWLWGLALTGGCSQTLAGPAVSSGASPETGGSDSKVVQSWLMSWLTSCQ